MKNETIVDRVVSRLKAQPLGDLITEEDLHEIVKQAIPKTFFEPRRTVENAGSYHAKTIDQEPLIVEVMRELLRGEAKKVIEQHIKDNAEHMLALWKQVFDAGLIKYVEDKQAEMVRGAMQGTLANLTHSINEDRKKAGLPPLPGWY